MADRERVPPARRAAQIFVGALSGLGLGLLIGLLLFKVGFLLPRAAARVTLVAPAVLGWLVLLGGAAGGFGREALSVLSRWLLPSGLDEGSRRLYLSAALVTALAVTQYHVAAFLLGDPTDLPSFLLAARAMLAGRDLYDPQVIASFADGTTMHEVIFPYLYLPLYAVLLSPLSYLSQAAAHAVVLIWNALLWPLLVVLCLRLVDVQERLRVPLLALVLLVLPSFLPTIQTFHHGSPSLLVAVLIVAVLILEREGRHRAAGVLLALVVLIKIVPVLLVGYLALRRRFAVLLWAALAAAALLLLSLAVAGVGPHWHWLTQMAPALAHGARTGTFFEPGCHPENQALTGVFCRFLLERQDLSRTLASATGALLALIATLALALRRGGALDRLESSLVVVTILLVSTITWFHHMTLMLLPALTLVAVGAERGGRRGATILACGLIVLVVVGFEFYLDPWPFVLPNPLTRTLRFQAMLLAFVALVALVIGDRRSRGERLSG